MNVSRCSSTIRPRVPSCVFISRRTLCGESCPIADGGRRRVVVTGVGLVTPLGVGVDVSWRRLANGESGITRLDGEQFADIPSKVGGCVPRGTHLGQWNTNQKFDKSESLATCYALVAAQEALAMARWPPQAQSSTSHDTAASLTRTGVCVGSCIPGLDYIVDSGHLLNTGKYRRISPYFIPRILINMPAGVLSVKHGFRGPNLAVTTACATGIHSIGEAAEKIRYGRADVMVAGGTEASIIPLAVAGFARAHALSTKFNSEPAKASRPFDAQRDGFVIGEGCGILVLEEKEHAVKRGARVLCEVIGYGVSGDAHHITAPSPEGFGATDSMASALHDARTDASDVNFLAAHATSTPLGDAAEASAVYSAFGDHCRDLHVTAFKGAMGHLLGAAGAVECIFSILALHHSLVPGICNLTSPSVSKATGKLNFVRQHHPVSLSKGKARIGMVNSFGFGGTNASLCLRCTPNQ